MNRLKSINIDSSKYTYNALGQRVEKKVGTAYTEYFFDTSGEAVGENNRTSWTVSVVTFQGRHLAHYQSSATYFMHGNSLGSTSQVTDYSGAMAQDQLYYPWGQEWNMVGSSQEKRFASLGHRDTTETGLDPTHFRMFSSTQGRWFSPDPKRGCPEHPQNLNRYAYVANSPTNRTDPRGDQYCDFYGCYCDLYFDPYCAYGYGYLGFRLFFIRTLYCECFNININHQPLFATCQFVCNCTGGYFGYPTIGAAAFTMPTLIKACGPIAHCPDIIGTVATTTFVFGLAITSNVQITSCIPN